MANDIPFVVNMYFLRSDDTHKAKSIDVSFILEIISTELLKALGFNFL